MGSNKKICLFRKISRAELIHAHGRTTLAFLVFVKSLRLINLPIIFHDRSLRNRTRPVNSLVVPILGKCSCKPLCRGLCQVGGLVRLARLPNQKITIIENAIDLGAICNATSVNIREKLNIPDNIAVGIVTCGIRREKGIDILLEALARSSGSERLKILVVGGERDKPYAGACRALNKALGLGEKVIFLGERLDARNLFQEVDFALVPSRSESGPWC